MPTTIHQRLLTQAHQALQALLTVPAQRVYLERHAAVDADDCPAINLMPDGGRFSTFGAEQHFGAGTLQAELGLSLRVHTRGDPHTTLADPVIAELHAALMADPSLGGLCAQLVLRDTRPIAALGDNGTAGTWELTYQATCLVDEATLQPLT